jgi:hypothetical protein
MRNYELGIPLTLPTRKREAEDAKKHFGYRVSSLTNVSVSSILEAQSF